MDEPEGFRWMRFRAEWSPHSHVNVRGLVRLVMDVKDILGSDLSMVELGSWAGESTSFFIGSGLFSSITLIDFWTDSFAEHVCRQNITGRKEVKMLKGNLQEIGKTWKEGEIDLLYIDADHSYEGTKTAIELWSKHIRPGGIIAGHDYNQNSWPGVVQAVDEAFADHTVRHYEDTSWLVVTDKKDHCHGKS